MDVCEWFEKFSEGLPVLKTDNLWELLNLDLTNFQKFDNSNTDFKIESLSFNVNNKGEPVQYREFAYMIGNKILELENGQELLHDLNNKLIVLVNQEKPVHSNGEIRKIEEEILTHSKIAYRRNFSISSIERSLLAYEYNINKDKALEHLKLFNPKKGSDAFFDFKPETYIETDAGQIRGEREWYDYRQKVLKETPVDTLEKLIKLTNQLKTNILGESITILPESSGRWFHSKKNDSKIQKLEALVGWLESKKENDSNREETLTHAMSFLNAICAINRYPSFFTSKKGTHSSRELTHLLTQADYNELSLVTNLKKITPKELDKITEKNGIDNLINSFENKENKSKPR